MSSSSYQSVEYIITNGTGYVPPELLRMRCAGVYIEFLKVSTTGLAVQAANNAKNHAVFKIDFDGRFENVVAGVRIDMRLDYGSASEPSDNGTHRYTPGDLKLKTCPYIGQSNSSARTIQLQYDRGQNLRLRDLLLSFMIPGVQLFGFVCRDDKHFGCRDFVTQALYQMYVAGYVLPDIISTTPVTTPLHVRNAFSALGMRFRIVPLGQGSACPIDRGGYEQYNRVERGFMPYEGTQAAADLANRLA